MEHHMAQAQARRPYLSGKLFSQQDQPLSFQPGIEVGLLCSEPNGSQLDPVGALREVPSGRKRRGRKPTLTPQEKRNKKIEADRNCRKKHKEELEKLRAVALKFGELENMDQKINGIGAELRRLKIIEKEFLDKINEMEAKLRRFNGIEQGFRMHPQTPTEFHGLEKFGGIEEMESKLYRFDQRKFMIGGIDEMVIETNRPKNMEFRHIGNEQMESLNHQNAQHTDYHGMQSQVQGSTIDWLEGYEISQMFPAAALGTVPDLVYSAAGLNEFIAQFDDYEMSNIRLYGFNNLHGECQIVGDYTFTQPLDCSANDIFNTEHSDATRNDQSTFNWAFTNNQFDWLLG